MRMSNVSIHAVVGALLALTAACSAFGSDWPQFQGLTRDGVSPETGLARSWPEANRRLTVLRLTLSISATSVREYTRVGTMAGRSV